MPPARRTLADLPDAADLGVAVTAALAENPVASLLALDLDEFHQVNAVHGHETGDRVIEAAGAVLADAARAEGWTLARIGGDAFALLAPRVALEAAFLRADRLRADLNAALARALPNGTRCTASIGVASAPRDAKRAEDLVYRADLALYAAKEQGGNTVALTPEEDMVLRSSYYPAAQLARLRRLAERLKVKEAVLLREGLDEILKRYDRPT